MSTLLPSHEAVPQIFFTGISPHPMGFPDGAIKNHSNVYCERLNGINYISVKPFVKASGTIGRVNCLYRKYLSLFSVSLPGMISQM